MARYIMPTRVRALAHEHDRRISAAALDALDRYVASLLDRAASVHNGGKRTIDATVIDFVAGKLN